MKPKNRTIVTHRDSVVDEGTLTDQVESNLHNSDAKNNNSPSPKALIVSNVTPNDNKEFNTSKINKCESEKVAIKFEGSDIDLGSVNIQKFNAIDSTESKGHKTIETNSDLGQNTSEETSESLPNKRKHIAQSTKSSQIKETEELFIRLKNKKPKVSRKQLETSEIPITDSQLLIKQEVTAEPPEKPSLKYSKTVSRQNLMSVNKTESLKLEQMLLEKARKTKERLGTEETSIEISENSTSEVEIEPYVYEKTSKSVFETYERKEEENGQVILKCLLCPFHSEKFKQMSLHYKFKHKETPIEEMHFCDVKGCRFKTIHQGMFKWHMRRHRLATDKITTSLFPCDQCDKVFDHRKGYLIHLKHKHRDPSPTPKKTVYPCSTCNFTTTTEPNLQAHIYRCHIPDNIKPTLTCNICGYKTHYKDCFKKHLTRVHLKKDK